MNQEPLFKMAQAGVTSDDFYTPKWVFDALKVEFDLDVASPPGGPAFTPCKRFYTQLDDGLSSDWVGTVFMNPPYSKPAPWVERFLSHGDGIALLPFAKSKWLETLWQNENVKTVFLYAVKFDRADSKLNGSVPFPLGIWGMGETAIKALFESGLGTVR
jgi:phage N-6-adenine-methyltransferase